MKSTPDNLGGGRKIISSWLGRFATALVVLIAGVVVYMAYLVPPTEQTAGKTFAQFQKRVEYLEKESNPINRDAMCIPLSAFCRSIDFQIPTNARVFFSGMLGPENGGKLGYYYFLAHYLFPREVAISMDHPAHYTLSGMTGRNPDSSDELKQAGYDLLLKMTPDDRWQNEVLRPMQPPSQQTPAPVSKTDPIIAFLLPLAVALAGARLIKVLMPDLKGTLSMGEWLACGLGIGAFVVTQTILGLRMAGAKLELVIAYALLTYAVVELALQIKRWKAQAPHFDLRLLWSLALIPAAMMIYCLFRLAGLEGLQEFDAVAFWVFKGKIFFLNAGNDLWSHFKNPAFGYAHMDYPLTVSLLYTFTYGALGHINEFVLKFWNQWMLALLLFAILGAGKFPKERPWLVVSVATVVVLTPMTLEYARMEGGTIPLFFYTLLGSLQLVIGITEKQTVRLQLGLLLFIAAAMVKFEGMILLGLWGLALLLDKNGRAAIWPPQRVGLACLLGVAMWIPYFLFRLHGPVGHPDNVGMKLLLRDWRGTLDFAPMTWVALVSQRFCADSFAVWTSPDNLHAVWAGKWSGLASFADEAIPGVAWACLLMLILACCTNVQNFRRATLYFLFVFLAFATLIIIPFMSFATYAATAWNAAHPDLPPRLADYTTTITRGVGGRYLDPILISWFVGSVVLLIRALPERPRPVLASSPTRPIPRKGNK